MGTFKYEKFDWSTVVSALMHDTGWLMIKLNLTERTGNRGADYYKKELDSMGGVTVRGEFMLGSVIRIKNTFIKT